MSYAKILKKSPFKTLSLTLGKLPDGSIWQTAFITQDGGDAPSAYFECHSDATAAAAERKGFFPLVKEALKRAQSLDELIDMLKPCVETPAEPVSPKVELLHLMKNEDRSSAIRDVLNSGLLPEPQLQQWLNNLVERAIRRMLGHSGCPEWEDWASKWLSGEDRSAEAASRAAEAASRAAEASEWAAALVARAAEAAAWAAEAAARAARAAEAAVRAARASALAARAAGVERKAQYDDLFNLINTI